MLIVLVLPSFEVPTHKAVPQYPQVQVDFFLDQEIDINIFEVVLVFYSILYFLLLFQQNMTSLEQSTSAISL